MRRIRGLWPMAVVAIGAFLVSGTAPGDNCDERPFLNAALYPVGDDVEAVAVADLTGDGVADIASIGDFPSGLRILPGNGDGTFGAAVLVGDYYSTHLLAADVSGDGKADLAFGGSGPVTVLLSNGDGTFQPPVVYPVAGGHVSELLAADLTGTGILDLVVSESDEVIVLPGNGDGTFGSAIFTSVEVEVGAIAIGDFEPDGKLDVVATQFQAVTVARGNGDRTFQPATPLSVGPGLRRVAVSDVNGDAKLDIGVTIQNYAEVEGDFVGVLLSNGDGTFQAAIETFAGAAPGKLFFLDLDGDGDVDAAAGFGSGLVVLEGDGSGGFGWAAGYLAGTRDLAVGDFNGDDLPDFAGVSGLSASVLLGNGGARFRSVASVETQFGVSRAISGDFDGDGLVDVIVSGYSNSVVALLPGNGDGTFQAPVPVYGEAYTAETVAGDWDGDGLLDLAVSGYDAGMAILLGNGDGTFREGEEHPGVGVRLAADVDGDGRLDLLVSPTSSFALLAALGRGDGTFSAPIESAPPAFGYALQAGDFNGDGRQDLALLQSIQSLGPGRFVAMLSLGDGRFQKAFEYITDFASLGVAVADVNRDGKTDVLAAASRSGLLLFPGKGDGTFENPITIDNTHGVQSVLADDFDGDGLLDIVTTNFEPSDVSFFRGQGGGAFDPPVAFAPGGAGRAVAAVPFSGSLPDVLIVDGQTRLFLLLHGPLSPRVLGRSVVVGSGVELKASASGSGSLSYQWRKGGVVVVDGGGISGAGTSVLKFASADFADAGSYDVVVTDSCGRVVSNAAVLSVEFADVPQSYQFHGAILKIAVAGLTSGCGGADYCPEDLVNRGQTAVFLLRGEHGGTYLPPQATGTVFGDVPADAPFARWIEQAALEAITRGCSGGNYCPAALVRRGDMAVFLLRAKHGGTYLPPLATGTVFTDVPADAPFARWIEQLAAEGISSGCGGGKYCPDATVTRGEMAAFLARTFGL